MTTGVTLSTGVTASPGSPIVLAQSGIPMYMPGNGTITAGGTLALTGTALDQIFANAFFWFPANTVATVAAAGMYFVQMTSTSAGTVFLNTVTNGSPVIPTTLVPCTTATNYTQTTAALVSLITVTVPANTMGPNGRVKVTVQYQNDTTNTKTFSIKFGGTQMLGTTGTANQSLSIIREILNMGVTNAQVSTASGITGTGAAAGASQRYTKDTTLAVDVTIQTQLATATDWVGVDSFSVEVFPGF